MTLRCHGGQPPDLNGGRHHLFVFNGFLLSRCAPTHARSGGPGGQGEGTDNKNSKSLRIKDLFFFLSLAFWGPGGQGEGDL